MNANKPIYYFNGKFVNDPMNSIALFNRAINYGDGLFETIKINDGFPQYFEDHVIRLEKGIKALKLIGNIDFYQIKKIICEQTNSIQHTSCKIIVFRSDGGKYLPTNHQLNWILEINTSLNLNHIKRPINEIGIYSEIKKEPSIISAFKTNNSLLYIMASIFAIEQNLDDVFILNSQQKIIETSNSNLFIRKGKTIYTPPICDGPIDGIMRKQIIKYINSQNIFTIKYESIEESDLQNADEIFVTNTIAGVKSVIIYNSKILNTDFADYYNRAE